jgi:predicted transcriptional regulator
MGRPRKPDDEEDDTVSVTFRLPRDMHERLSRLADADERSLNLYVTRALRSHLESLPAERDGVTHGSKKR